LDSRWFRFASPTDENMSGFFIGIGDLSGEKKKRGLEKFIGRQPELLCDRIGSDTMSRWQVIGHRYFFFLFGFRVN
jgi:hypothetical protein